MNRRGVNGRHGRRVLELVVAASRHKRVNVEATFVGGTVQLHSTPFLHDKRWQSLSQFRP